MAHTEIRIEVLSQIEAAGINGVEVYSNPSGNEITLTGPRKDATRARNLLLKTGRYETICSGKHTEEGSSYYLRPVKIEKPTYDQLVEALRPFAALDPGGWPDPMRTHILVAKAAVSKADGKG